MEQGILVLATQRCAGTNIAKGIASFYSKRYAHEPNVKTISWSDKDVVKVISNNTAKEYIPQFKNIILVTRRDMLAAQESLGVMYYKGNTTSRYDNHIIQQKWNDKYLNEIKKDSQYKVGCNRVEFANNVLKSISKQYSLPIEYTEDILKEKKLRHSDIKIDPDYLEPSLKLRATWDKSTI